MKIDHVNIVVSDMDRSVEFYKRLGLSPSMDTFISGAWIANVVGIQDENLRARVVFMEPDSGNTRLELIQYIVPVGQQVPANSQPNTQGLRHFALVVDDIMKTYQELLQAGITFFSEPQEVTGNKDVEARIGRKKLVYFLDPDGAIVELAEYRLPSNTNG
jgi:catechol 2,3-dioxygenase-like lactoylglutathione lyase family enzyme